MKERWVLEVYESRDAPIAWHHSRLAGKRQIGEPIADLVRVYRAYYTASRPKRPYRLRNLDTGSIIML